MGEDEVTCSRCMQPTVDGLKMCQYHREYANQMNAAQPKNKLYAGAKRCRLKLKLEVLSHYGNSCRCCGEDHLEFLTIDHINGGGADHRRRGISGSALHRWLKKNGFPVGFRTLCVNCNLAMGIHGRCPHNKLKPQRTNHPANPYRK